MLTIMLSPARHCRDEASKRHPLRFFVQVERASPTLGYG